MKTKLVNTVLFISLTLFSCKNNEPKESPDSIQEVKPNTFEVTLDLVIKTDDELILFYKNGPNQWFDDEKTVWYSVKGSEEAQSVVFNLPEGVLPTDLRIDIGRNEMKNLKEIEIKKIAISYLDKVFEIQHDKIDTYFKPNQCMSYDSSTKMYTFKKDEKGIYDPFLEAQPDFYPQLAKIILKN
jgi:hypothetical protein